MAAALGYTSQARVSELEKGHVSVSGPIGQFLAHLDARGPLPVRQAPVEA
jgi:hypothetical protein